MELIILPLFFPLLLVGWVFDDATRLARRRDRDLANAYARTWLALHGSFDELAQVEAARAEQRRG